ncbi:uncharacterized protein KQ657_003208 [Scheffersomyces spartinae]|uniref:EF-hand domain-containing protein n=1 Tax=Scheffersomyces spartinae TaxID=45513 RepID=A0A9P7VDS0_9ASCO|nr:uncharacterized protein KQ657_003208 [Scheffersomyces spartinae]KAG7195446.1 hypothetical protein KQ657_003208 [Scheffersomyces spartinae]
MTIDVIGVVDRHNGYGRPGMGQRKTTNPKQQQQQGNYSQPPPQQQQYYQPQPQQYQPSRIQHQQLPPPQVQQPPPPQQPRYDSYSRHNQSQPLLYLTTLNPQQKQQQQLYTTIPIQQQQAVPSQYQQYLSPPQQLYQQLNHSQQHYQQHYQPKPQQQQQQQHYAAPPQQTQGQYSNYQQQRPPTSLAHGSYEQQYPHLHYDGHGRTSVESIPTRVSPPQKRPSNGEQTIHSVQQHMERVNISENAKPLTSAQKKLAKQQKLENELRATFDRVDTNHTGIISPSELARALSNFDNTPFKESTVILMIKLFGSSNPKSGSLRGLNFEQFVDLWKHLLMYKKLFLQADSDKLGDISFGEFHEIVKEIGYRLDVDLVLFVFQKFCPKDVSDIGRLKFDVFIELLVYLRKVTDIFKKYDEGLTGVASIPFADFLLEVTNL